MEKDKKYVISVVFDTTEGPEEYEVDAATLPLEKLADLLEFHPELTELYYTRYIEERSGKASE